MIKESYSSTLSKVYSKSNRDDCVSLDNLRLMPFPERDNLGDGFHSDYTSFAVNVFTIGKLIIFRIILEKAIW